MDDSPVHVLLIEDNPTDATLLHQVFLRVGKVGWRMSHVERLTDAMTICQTSTFVNVILLSLRSESQGLAAIVELRSIVCDIPIVVLATQDDEELALQALAAGVQDYLVKDQITIQLLVRSIRYAIEREKGLNQLKQNERQISQALEQEKQLNQLRSNFLSIASHQFRTPLSIIRSSTELLQRFNHQLADEGRLKHFDRIYTSLGQMLSLIDQVLLLGSVETEGLKFQPLPLNLESFCRELAETVQFSMGNQSHIIFSYQGCCAQAEMDPILLEHIFTNLLSNAIKYSPEKPVVRFHLICSGETATFNVQDQGIGIPQADQPYLFQSFYRCRNVGRITGTGLGLCIAKKCVELHRGQIQLISDVGVGTTFTVTLPLKPPD
jgi:signal transduction histidine kinase